MTGNQVYRCEITLSYFFYWLEQFMKPSLVQLRFQKPPPSHQLVFIFVEPQDDVFSISFELQSKWLPCNFDSFFVISLS